MLPLVQHHPQSMLRHPLLKIGRFNAPIVADRVEIAYGEAFAAADALLGQDVGLLVFLDNRIDGAPLDALPAESTDCSINVRLH